MPKRLDLPLLHEWIDAYNAGESLLSISNRTGVARTALVVHFRREGVAIRSRSDAEQAKWDTMRSDPDRVARQVAAAHTARRGQRDSLDVRIRRAQTVHARLLKVFTHEQAIAGALRTRGLAPEQQYPIGPYNADIAFPAQRLIVEVSGSGWTTQMSRVAPRCRRLLEDGWAVVYVHLATHNNRIAPLDPAPVADRLVDLLRQANELRGTYAMIDHNGHAARRKTPLGDLPRAAGL